MEVLGGSRTVPKRQCAHSIQRLINSLHGLQSGILACGRLYKSFADSPRYFRIAGNTPIYSDFALFGVSLQFMPP